MNTYKNSDNKYYKSNKNSLAIKHVKGWNCLPSSRQFLKRETNILLEPRLISRHGFNSNQHTFNMLLTYEK